MHGAFLHNGLKILATRTQSTCKQAYDNKAVCPGNQVAKLLLSDCDGGFGRG